MCRLMSIHTLFVRPSRTVDQNCRQIQYLLLTIPRCLHNTVCNDCCRSMGTNFVCRKDNIGQGPMCSTYSGRLLYHSKCTNRSNHCSRDYKPRCCKYPHHMLRSTNLPSHFQYSLWEIDIFHSVHKTIQGPFHCTRIPHVLFLHSCRYHTSPGCCTLFVGRLSYLFFPRRCQTRTRRLDCSTFDTRYHTNGLGICYSAYHSSVGGWANSSCCIDK